MESPIVLPFSAKHVEVDIAGREGHHVYKFDHAEHSRILARNLGALLNARVLDDVTLIAEDGRRFRFHGALLAASSPVFRDVFAGTPLRLYQGEFAPQDADPGVLAALQEYIYRRSDVITYDGDWSRLVDFASGYGFEGMLTGFAEPADLVDGLNSMWEKLELTYTVVKVNDSEYPCHDCVLAASSPVIFNQFSTHPIAKVLGGLVTLRGLQDIAFGPILKFIYSAELTLNVENVGSVLEAASHLKFPGVSWACIDYIVRHLSPENALGCLQYGQRGFLAHLDDFHDYLVKRAREYVVSTFAEVIHHEEFLYIPSEADILDYLIEADKSSVDYVTIISCLLKWLDWEESGRKENFARLISSACCIFDRNGFIHVMKKSASHPK